MSKNQQNLKKKCLFKNISLGPHFLLKVLFDNFNFRCFVFQNDAQFLTTRHYVNFQNTIFSFEILIFGQKSI